MKTTTRRILALAMCLIMTVSVLPFAGAAVAQSESESNNTLATANTVSQDSSVTAYISTVSDVDYFKVTPTQSGKMSFSLSNIPFSNGESYHLGIYNSAGTLLGSSTYVGQPGQADIISVTKGTNYYVKIYSYGGAYSASKPYTLTVKLQLSSYKYWSNKSPQNFPITNLSNLYYKKDSTTLSDNTWLYKLTDAGCYMSSFAMVLSNLGAKTTSNQYDVRTGKTEILTPDPFTVSLSNVRWPSITYTGGKYVANTTENPVVARYLYAVQGFGKTYALSAFSSTASETAKADEIAYQLSLHPEGLIVTFANHALVFTSTTHIAPVGYTPITVTSTNSIGVAPECSISELTRLSLSSGIMATAAVDNSAFNVKFTVYDPADQSNVGVTFGKSWTATQYRFAAAKAVIVIK